jgi:2-polyprenyl-3-methyl-5-hydroxy-6-metoxy-1,4-benzoquinol methylase
LWCALAQKAQVCGVEYAENSHQQTAQLFSDAQAPADIRHEDFMKTTFEPNSFDVVYSFGVIEHFTDPRPMVNKHLDMLKSGGVAIITVPNFGSGIYGWLQQRLSRENYDLHNISIMTEREMLKLAPEGSEARSYVYGRISPFSISLEALPRPIGTTLSYGLNAAALLQPFEIRPLCPWLVLEMRKAG